MKYSDEIQQKCGKKIRNRTMFLVTLLVILFPHQQITIKAKVKIGARKTTQTFYDKK